ncbi:MAG: Clp protease N-terminal domain-containing protein, partial [Paludibacteraceae bacterium]|nr:Clp protease N-terminal domain-containing protein [Paludibacteraceae bacterium]
MNFEKFTIKSQEAIQKAIEIAQNGGQQAIETAHLLKGVMLAGEGVCKFLFAKLGVNAQVLSQAVDSQIQSYPKVTGGNPYFSNETSKVLDKAVSLSDKDGHSFVPLEMILMALLTVNNGVQSMLKNAGFTEKGLESAIAELTQNSKTTSKSAEETYQSLSKYAINLNDKARSGKLDPVIGRDEEIRRVLQILSRRTKNNPILIGEPGVGKTAIAEGLAHRIVRGDVPENLKSKQLYSLDM